MSGTLKNTNLVLKVLYRGIEALAEITVNAKDLARQLTENVPVPCSVMLSGDPGYDMAMADACHDGSDRQRNAMKTQAETEPRPHAGVNQTSYACVRTACVGYVVAEKDADGKVWFVAVGPGGVRTVPGRFESYAQAQVEIIRRYPRAVAYYIDWYSGEAYGVLLAKATEEAAAAEARTKESVS